MTSSPVPQKISVDSPSDTLNWATLFPVLGLTGPTQALAAHCSLVAVQNDCVALRLGTSHAPLLNKKHEERIAHALTHYFGKPMKVVIDTGKPTEETPAERQKREQKEKLTTAHQRLQHDDHVQAIIGAFNATIVPESITTT